MKIKKILAFLTSTAMLAASLNVSAFATVGPGSGDVNGDGSITKADADLTMEYVLNPASTSIAAYKDLIEAQGDVTGYDCENDCGITAKDVALILQMVAKGSLDASIYVTAGKLAEGANVFRPIEWDGTTEDAARLSAQEELEEMSVNDFYDKYFGDIDNETRMDQANNFLDKVYLNDYKLTSAECASWAAKVVDDTGNQELMTFVDDFFDAIIAGITPEKAQTLFKQFNDITLTNADIEAIKNSEDFTWFRTNFQIVVYDADTYSDSKTTMKHYDDHYSNYGISVVDWYFFNNTEVIPRIAAMGFSDYSDTVYGKYASPTTEQPFKDNVISTLTDIVKPYLDVVNNADNTVKEALDAIGGDRVEITVNTGTFPDVVDKGDTIASYDDFVTEFGTSFDDPCTTYYVDFSKVGYDFSSGSGSSDVTTEATTEAPTETTTEAATTSEETTTTEAETESATETETESATEAQSEETTEASNPYSLVVDRDLSTDMAEGDTLTISGVTMTALQALTYEVIGESTIGDYTYYNALKSSGTNTSVVVDGATAANYRIHSSFTASEDCTITIATKVPSGKKVSVATLNENGSYTSLFYSDGSAAAYADGTAGTIGNTELTFTLAAGDAIYLLGSGTNLEVYAVNVSTGSDTPATTTTTEAASETTTAEATTTTEAASETTTEGDVTAVSLTVTKNTNGNDGITITETDGV